MGENSAIAWTDHTFNPWIGCQKVSDACDNCYAETWDKRFKGERWGPHAVRTRTADANWRKPFKWNKDARVSSERQRVFCASLSDWLDNHKSILPQWRNDLFYMIDATPNLDWLLLTKRPHNYRQFAPRYWSPYPKNVWLGTTVEGQKAAEQRLWDLCQCLGKIKFISYEPALGPLDLTCVKTPEFGETFNALTGELSTGGFVGRIGWVIAGGESGPNYRPSDPDWFRSLRDQCIAHDVPFLFKQYGGKTRKEIDAKGRELDGVVWNEFPEVER